MRAFSLALPRVSPLAARPDKRFSIVWFAFFLFRFSYLFGQTNRSRDFLHPRLSSGVGLVPKRKTHRLGAFLFLEQVTRVELAGNSLGSCRHTARRHLHYSLIIYLFSCLVNAFSPLLHSFFLKLSKSGNAFFVTAFLCILILFSRTCAVLATPEKFYRVIVHREIVHYLRAVADPFRAT